MTRQNNFESQASGQPGLSLVMWGGRLLAILCTLSPLVLLSGCGGGGGSGGSSSPVPSLYTVGVTVTGLNGSGLVLQDNAADNLNIAGNGNFTFATSLSSDAAYGVSVLTQPANVSQTCIATNATGTVANAAISNIVITCTTNTYTVGVTVTGLSGSGLVLQDNAADNLNIAGNGNFTFATSLSSGAAYGVSVLAQPTNLSQTCVATNATGTVTNAAISNIAITCTTNTYTVGVTVTGLHGSGLIVQDNATDSLNVTGNGNFTFVTPIVSNGSYQVRVLASPTNPTQPCSISSSNGTVTNGNITNIAVNCTDENVFYIPGNATPASSGGQSGLFVIPSNAPTTPPVFVDTGTISPLYLIDQKIFDGTGGALTSYSPYSIIYTKAGQDGKVRLYALSLSDTSAVPTPRQLSNLSMSALSSNSSPFQLCYFGEARTDITNPESVFLLVQVSASDGTCGDVFQLIHYDDNSGVTPTTVNVHTAQFVPIYDSSGALGGVVMLDSTTNNLVFMSGATFTAPVILAANVTNFSSLGISRPLFLSTGNGAELFAVTTSSGAQSIYRIDSSGHAVNEYTVSGSAISGSLGNVVGPSDGIETFFSETDQVAQTVTLLQEPLSGGTPIKLVTFTESTNDDFQIRGSNGSTLVYQVDDEVNHTATLYAVPLGVQSANAATLATFSNSDSMRAWMDAPSPVQLDSSVIYANNTFADFNSDGSSTNFSYYSESLASNGTVVQPLTKNSIFLGRATYLSGSLFQVRGITSSFFSYGGGTLYDVNIATAAAIPYTTMDGSNYVLPQYAEGLGQLGISNTIGSGQFSQFIPLTGATMPGIGFIYNINTHNVVPITLPNTNIFMPNTGAGCPCFLIE